MHEEVKEEVVEYHNGASPVPHISWMAASRRCSMWCGAFSNNRYPVRSCKETMKL